MDLKTYLSNEGYHIDDFEIMVEAFTHTSYVNEQKIPTVANERLELLGDAVLQLWVSRHLFFLKPPLSEGDMTLIRSRLVNEGSLAKFARQLNLGAYLRLGVGEEKTGGRNRDSILADLMEAFLGVFNLQKDKENVDRCLKK